MIHLVGLGGVGFWLATGLVRSVREPITCWDDDTLEGGTGHTRLPIAPPNVTKCQLLQGFLLVSMGDDIPHVHFQESRFSGRRMVSKGDIVIDCSDMPLPLRKRVWTYASRAGARLLRVSYDGLDSIVVVATGLPIMAKKGGGYAATPSLALSLAAGGIGAEVVRRFINNPVEHFDFQITLGEVVP